MSRSTWVFAGLGIAVIVVLMSWMGRTLDTKAPIRIERPQPVEVPVVPTRTPEEEAAREEAAMERVVKGAAVRLAARAAAQAFPAEDAAAARCAFAGASLVHRDGETAYWNASFSCSDPRAPGALPNLTSVSVRLRRDPDRWVVEE